MKRPFQKALWKPDGLGPGFALGIAVTLAVQIAGSVSNLPSAAVKIDSLSAMLSDRSEWLMIAALAVLAMASIAAAAWAWQRYQTAAAPATRVAGTRSEHRTRSPDAAARGAREQADVNQARAEIDRQLAALVGFVSRYLDATSDHSLKIAQAQTRLEQATTIEQVQVVIRLLVASNAQARRDAEDLKARLIESRNHAAKIQSNLAEAVNLATLDALTNLPNRRRLEEYLEDQIAQSHRDDTPLCLVIADIDHFKAINDKFGHPSGDAVLKQFSDLLSKGLRHTDFSARYGGEEFVVVLPRTPLGNAVHVIEGLRAKLREAKWFGVPATRAVGKVTASFGIAEIRDDETLEQFIDRADQKLYEAKQGGRDRIEVDHNV